MKRLAHRRNNLGVMWLDLHSGEFAGIECDIQFDRGGHPVLCHDRDDADYFGNPSLADLRPWIAAFPERLFFIEIKRCTWRPEYREHFEVHPNVVYLSFDQSIVDAFAPASALITGRGGRYDMTLPDGSRASTYDETAEYLIK